MQKLTKEEFIQRSINIHKDVYDYSKVNYINTTTKVIVICPLHGEFYMNESVEMDEDIHSTLNQYIREELSKKLCELC